MSSSASVAFRPSRFESIITFAAIWALCIVTFRLPGRLDPEQAGSLDLLALAKLAVRTGVLGIFLLAWRWNPDHAAKRSVLAIYFPFALYVCWAFFSVLWSPLKTVSLGQALGLAALLMFSAWIALSCRIAADAAAALKQLWSALLFFVLVVLSLHIVQPELAGLNRDHSVEGADGIVRPTAAGATAGLGFMLTLLGPKTIPGFRLGNAMLPALAAHGALLYFANSRTALAMTALIALIALWRFYSTAVHAKLLVALSGLICLSLALDPGFVFHEDSSRASAAYLSRGQTGEQLAQASGRQEMWEAVWGEFQLSPVIGHGYFVTSRTGRLDVWDGPSNHTAHHVLLQVLVSTGLIGGVLFMIALLKIIFGGFSLRRGDRLAKGVFLLSMLAGLWFLGWSQTCISFMGPILPESVCFYLIAGLVVGQVVRMQAVGARTPA